jgi:hypothetical protein
VHTTEYAPNIRVTSACSDLTSLLVSQTLVGGAMARGAVSAGDVYLTVEWRNGKPTKPYTLDVLGFALAPACSSAKAWDLTTTTTGSVTGDTMTAADKTSGCSPDKTMGAVFFAVTVPDPSYPWQFTAQPQANSTVNIQSVQTCSATTCLASPVASATPGAAATITVTGATTFLVAVNAEDAMTAGPFTLTATRLAQCTNEGGACGSNGICCGQHCQQPTTGNQCGHACTACPAPAHSTPACSNGACDFTCDSGYTKCGTGCFLATDPTHCGPGPICNDCTMQQLPPNASAWTCSAGACVPTCNSAYCPNGASCVSDQTDPSNCGACGSSCLAQKGPPPMNASWQCSSGTCQPKCNGGNWNGTSCTPWTDTCCGTFCTNCQLQWQTPHCNVTTGVCQ